MNCQTMPGAKTEDENCPFNMDNKKDTQCIFKSIEPKWIPFFLHRRWKDS